MADEEVKGKCLGDHLESLGNMSLPITGQKKVDKILTRVMFLGGVCVVGVWAASGIADVFQMGMALISSVVDLIPNKSS